VSKERVRRVNEVIRQVLSEAIGELSDPGLGFVTITGVDCTPDFEHATVYVQILGSERKRERGLAALERARGPLQERIARQVRLRRVPHLSFAYDGSLDRGMRIGDLLAEHEFAPDVPEGEDEGVEPEGSEEERP
jgi:ribosome-binding factor A